MDLQVIGIGNSLGVTLPKELLQKLKVEKGDKLYVTDTPSGIELHPYDPEFIRQIEVGMEIIREDRDVLKKLAE